MPPHHQGEGARVTGTRLGHVLRSGGCDGRLVRNLACIASLLTVPLIPNSTDALSTQVRPRAAERVG